MDATDFGDAPQDLSHAGSVVDKAIEYMLGQGISEMSVASALLGGSLGLLHRNLGEQVTAKVLRQALASVEAGEFREVEEPPQRPNA
jgi:hypothetical protein